MIKFFRKIRYDYLRLIKLRNYLKYAAGEIILVVIGILIAVQINKWKEERKETVIEMNMLNEISESLSEEIVSLENDIRLNKMGIENVEMIENVIVSQDTESDTFLTEFEKITFNETIHSKVADIKTLLALGFRLLYYPKNFEV